MEPTVVNAMAVVAMTEPMPVIHAVLVVRRMAMVQSVAEKVAR